MLESSSVVCKISNGESLSIECGKDVAAGKVCQRLKQVARLFPYNTVHRKVNKFGGTCCSAEVLAQVTYRIRSRHMRCKLQVRYAKAQHYAGYVSFLGAQHKPVPIGGNQQIRVPSQEQINLEVVIPCKRYDIDRTRCPLTAYRKIDYAESLLEGHDSAVEQSIKTNGRAGSPRQVPSSTMG